MLSRIRHELHNNFHRLQNIKLRPQSSLVTVLQLSRRASGSSQEAVSTYQRLSDIYKLFRNEKLFKKSSLKCYNIYKHQDLLLLKDVLSYPHINQDILSFLFLGFRQSKSMKALIYQNLFDLLLMRDFAVFSDTIQRMSSERLVSQKFVKSIQSVITSFMNKDDVFKQAAEQFIIEVGSAGEPFIAASFAVQLLEGKVFLHSNVMERLVLTLADLTSEPSFMAYTIHKLIKLYGHKNISTATKLGAINGMLKEPYIPFYANHLYDTIKPLMQGEKLLAPVLVNLISANTEKGHLCRTIDLWKDLRVSFPEVAATESSLIEKISLRIAEEDVERAAAFLETVPEEAKCNSGLLETSISIVGRCQNRYDEFTNLSKHLTAPLSRKALSSLFISFLHQNNENASDKMLKAIFKTPTGLNSNDFDAIIRKLLRRGKLEKSLEMCYNTDVHISKLGYLRVLDHLLLQGDVNHNGFCDHFCRQFKKLSNTDIALHTFTTTLFRHFSKRIKNSVSRTLYISKAYKDAFHKEAGFNFRRLDLPTKFNDLILIDDQNRIACLNIIYKQAISEQDQVNIKWCLDELKSLGVSLGDIIAHYLKI